MQKQMSELDLRVKSNMEKIKHKIVVMSGKGGVGKSTVSTNIAYGLALKGYKVGIVDADLHGPNVALMLGQEGKKLPTFEPISLLDGNLKVVSLSFFLGSSDDPIIWRGPAKIGAINQLLGDVIWGELDYLVVDLPPGTGDEPLTIAQSIGKADGSVIVTTPQDVAILDSRKSVKFSRLVNLPILGVVENMSGFVCPHCGERIDIFKTGGGEKAANELGVEFLGKIPMNPSIVNAGDSGKPYIASEEKNAAHDAINDIINKLVEKTQK
ncbi:P-loop NTPase [Fusobacterium sp. MFO224]|uniref:P-loop NTPase n=1 Tax=Fusobacterium sp. MFO224 TaxID=3378070 RepID=UPI0038520DB3